MQRVRFRDIFKISEARRNRKNLIADLDLAPESYLKRSLGYQIQNFCWTV